MMPFAFWKSSAALVLYQPPTEGTSFSWQIAPGSPGVDGQVISNPNDVTMTVTWVEFPSPEFGGPGLVYTIPAHGSVTMYVTGTGGLDTDTTTGTWSTGYASGALAGDAECS